jgi:Lamin Tail Domain
VSAHVNLVRKGQNMLALHAMNGTVDSADLLFQARLLGGPATQGAGEISADALEYTGPISLTTPTEFFVRTFDPTTPVDPPSTGAGPAPNGTGWSGATRLYYFPGAVAASAATLALTEVFYHPEPSSASEQAAGHANANDFEFIRLTNTSDAPVDLTGLHFTNGLEFTAGPGLGNWLAPGESVVIVENAEGYAGRFGNTYRILGSYGGELDDGGEHLVLEAKDDSVIADLRYDDSTPWPTEADDGHSLQFLGGNPNDASSWQASLDPGGSGVEDYDDWRQRHFVPGDIPTGEQAPDADADGDGQTNLHEYALCSDPLDATSGEQAMTLAAEPNAIVRLMRRRDAAEIEFTLEVSPDMVTWAVGEPPASIAPNDDGTETVTWTLPSDSLRQFVRVRIAGL